MPDFHTAGYTGGYTSARNDQSSRDYQAQQMAHLVEMIQRSQFEQQMEQEKRQRRLQGEQVAGQILPQLLAGMGAPQVGDGPAPQPPEPGQASVPMMPPGAAPQQGMPPGPPPAAMMPPGGGMLMNANYPGTPPIIPQGSVPDAALPPQTGAAGAPPPPPPGAGMYAIADTMSPLQRMLAQADAERNGLVPMPQGWKPSAIAPENLGGPPPGAGGPPSQGPATIGADGEAILPPPPMPKGPAISVEQAISAMQKQGVPAQHIVPALEAMLPSINAQNAHAVANFKAETAAQKAAIDAYKATILRMRAGTYAEDVDSKIDRRDDLTTQGQRALDIRQGLGNRALDIKAASALANVGDLSPDVVDFYARQSIAGDNAWQVGLARGKVGQQLIAAVKDRIPKLAKETGQEPEDVMANKAGLVANSKALADRQKFVSSGNQFVRNMQSQADLIEKYMGPGAGGASPVVNRWIQAGRKAVAGDPDVSALDTAIRGLAREHQRIVTGVTSNAQLHVSAQQTADELLNINQSVPQLRAVMKVMREEADNAITAGKDEIASLRGTISQRPGQVPGAAPPTAAGVKAPPPTNPKGWKLMQDAQGNKAYVSPDGKQFEAL